MVVAIVSALAACHLGSVAGAELVLGYTEYRNVWMQPSPDPDISGHLSGGTAAFSGHVGPWLVDEGGTPTLTSMTDGTNHLSMSAVGWAVEGPTYFRADFKIGEEMVPPPEADPSKAPTIDPPVKAFYLAHAGKVIANEAGIVTITWKDAANADILPAREYLISSLPYKTPVAIYWTENSEGATGAPHVDLRDIPQVIVHYNSAIPQGEDPDGIPGTGDETHIVWKDNFGLLHARQKTGMVLLEVNDGAPGNLVGIEVVEIRPYLPIIQPATATTIGSQLLPLQTVERPAEPHIPKGLNLPAYIYWHRTPGLNYDDLFAVRRTTNEFQMEVFWRHVEHVGPEESGFDIVWPYEMQRYTADWPTSPQLFVRGNVTNDLGIPTYIPGHLNPTLMDFQVPVNHASLSGGEFSAREAGLSLLRYEYGNPVGSEGVSFEVVRSVLRNDAGYFDLEFNDWDIGWEITDPYHEGPMPGYIHVSEGDRYAPEVYADTGQVFAVNTGPLEVWWYNVSQEVPWPSLVKRYDCDWPVAGSDHLTTPIIIASTLGTGPLNPEKYTQWTIYRQPQANQPGYNPNEEHALAFNNTVGPVFALRDDFGSPDTSLPYVLIQYWDPAHSKWFFSVHEVVAERAPYFFRYPGMAGNLIQPPMPISQMPIYSEENYGVSGPYWEDRKERHWARAAGDDGGSADVVMRWFYVRQDDFDLPPVGGPFPLHMPWLDLRAGTPTVPINVTYEIVWPDDVPEMRLSETLVKPKFGLPDIASQCSADVIYQQSVAVHGTISVRIMDPTRKWSVDLAELPDEIERKFDPEIAEYRFPQLPPHLASRISYDDINKRLNTRGLLVEPPLGEYYLLPNRFSEVDALDLFSLSFNPAYQEAVADLFSLATVNLWVAPGADTFDSLALFALPTARGGYVTLAFQNNENTCDESLPVSLSIIRVTCPLNRGEIKIVEADCAFDEKLTLRHSSDFALYPDDMLFEWRTLPDVDGTPPTIPRENWIRYNTVPGSGEGINSITISGPGLFTLTDNWFVCRYRNIGAAVCEEEWSDWTEPQLAEGWIKRVLRGINPFEQRFTDLGDPTRQINTMVNMISQAGTRWVGDTALNCDSVDDFGLIEIYETVLRRGISLSIEGTPPVHSNSAPGIVNALLLAAGRISDLYMLLGNEAYADAADPTIGFGLNPTQSYLAAASSIHAFMNLTSSLIDEELALLRGRDDKLAPGVKTHPVYNRLVWNFAGGFGEVAYALNYAISDASGNVDGTIDEADARRIYPQGHGDAWGHYLQALKGYYRLMRNPRFNWIPRSEAVVIGGVPVTVDFLDERKFAKAAAAKARAGSEIVNLTYRSAYVESPAGQWQGYKDTDTERAWGLAEWGSRAGQGAYIDWAMGNAVLPDEDTANTGIQKIDRTTVVELLEIPVAFNEIQRQVDSADMGLNPLGLAKNVMPFDIDPSLVDSGKTHFEQIYERALQALNNANAVFQHANDSTQLLRRQSDTVTEFERNVNEREIDLRNRMIEVFGYPYPEDIGPAGAYPSGYNGPDLYHYMYLDPRDFGFDQASVASQAVDINVISLEVDKQGLLDNVNHPVTMHFSSHGFGLVKPPHWTGQRRAPGEIQMVMSEVYQARLRLEKSVAEYDTLLDDIAQRARFIEKQYAVRQEEIRLINELNNTMETLDKKIASARSSQLGFQKAVQFAQWMVDASVEGIPKVAGFSMDVTSAIRGTLRAVHGMAADEMMRQINSMGSSITDHQNAKQVAQAETNLKITTLKQEEPLQNEIAELQREVRREAAHRLEIYNLTEAMRQTQSNYLMTLARGHRLMEDHLRFRRETAADVQQMRYKDMAFRIFRNDALQKYRAQFDLAARYVYLAARAYDYETNLLKSDSRGPGQRFLTDIIRSRAIGLVTNGQPQTASSQGDPGLADPMARMFQNWNLVLKSQLGFNNPQTETNRFSMRQELFRVLPTGEGSDALWRETLRRHVVENLFDLPEFERFCAPFQPHNPVEPGIVIPFSTNINFGQNFFGWPLAGGDSAYDSSHFATKIRSVGVWFTNYNNVAGAGMSNTPRVYLIPVGEDVMRSPTGGVGDIRQFRILDQLLPIPFPISGADMNNPGWIPVNDSLVDSFIALRRYGSFRAYHDSGAFNQAETITNSRLIGRSVWNTRWLLIIPAGTLHSDRQEGLLRFIDGPVEGDERTGQGIKDIKIFFQTYAYGS